MEIKTLEQIENIEILGRTSAIRKNTPLFSALSGLEMNYRGCNLFINLEADFTNVEPWVCVELNGDRIIRYPLQKGNNRVQIIRGLTTLKDNYIRFFKDDQAIPEDKNHSIIIKSIEYDGEFLKLPNKSYNIEFIGDSLTSGEGAIGSSIETDWVPSFFDPYYSFERIVADKLNAEIRVVSESGWGVVCGWNNDPATNLPSVYERISGGTCFDKEELKCASLPYDFDSWVADAVFINLGTNDNSAFNQPEFKNEVTGETFKMRSENGVKNSDDVNFFIKGAENFIRLIRKNNKKAKIIWGYGMLDYGIINEIKTAVLNVNNSGDKEVYFLKLPNTADNEFGSLRHPGRLAHKNSAEVVTEYLKTIL